MDIKQLLKGETIAFAKTLVPVVIGIWAFAEPHVESYVHEQVEIVQKEDKRMIDSLKVKINKLQSIVDSDYTEAKDSRNDIIEEIQYIYPGSRLRIEK